MACAPTAGCLKILYRIFSLPSSAPVASDRPNPGRAALAQFVYSDLTLGIHGHECRMFVRLDELPKNGGVALKFGDDAEDFSPYIGKPCADGYGFKPYH
jgi:hypothetical protein